MPDLVFYLLLFFGIGVFFFFFHLMLGKVVRPIRPETEKLTIYECGEPTVGSAWVQFDLRYYVVALLFVIFDVEVAFFFPWAVVFGNVNTLSRTDVEPGRREALVKEMTPESLLPGAAARAAKDDGETIQAWKSWAWLAFVDLLVFFGVLMVGFAYLWRRGDLN